MRTSTRVEFGLYDVSARVDSSPASTSAQPFCDLEDLRLERHPPVGKFGTLESRQFLMDGSFSLFPDRAQGLYWGLWSRQLSDQQGRFADPPVLELSFSQPHSSAGLTLHFYAPTDDWCSELSIDWLGPGGVQLSSADFRPDAADYYCSHKVEDYRALRITFRGTSRPEHYLKLTGIDYGAALTFAGKEVVSARVLEEVDMLSNEISINTLHLTLYNEAAKFSILNPQGVFDVLQHKQKFTIYEDVRPSLLAEADRHNMGTFYLSDWENTSDTLASFTATDAVGLLDSAPHDGGIYDTSAAAMVDEILEGYDYELAPALRQERIRGFLPIGTRRSALQQLAFALGAIVDCSRSDKIRIYPAPERPSSLIRYSRKMVGSKVALKPLITGVAVTAHQYTLEPQSSELFSDDLDKGVYKVTFDAPAANLSVSGGSFTAWGNNFATVRVSAPSRVTITGYKFVDAQTALTKLAQDVPANAQANELSVTDATLVSPERAEAVADRILDYYARRYEQTFRMSAGDEVLGDMLIVESFGREKVKGGLESMEFDLTGGYIADVRVVGRRVETNAAAYTGEIYAGERSLI